MRYFIILHFLFAIIFSGCSLIDLKKDLEKQDKLVKIDVNIVVEKKEGSKVIVALVDNAKRGLSVINYRIIKNTNDVEFYAEPSSYIIFAFEDVNSDEKFSPNERMVKSATLDMTKEKSIFIRLKIDTASSRGSIDKIEKFKKNITLNLGKQLAYIGTVVSLDSEYFSQDNIKKGLWQPYAFIKDVPFGIFLLQEYDPNKKVVLFIHGISGSPKNFSYLIENLDKSKYQVMVAYYPTALSANFISEYFSRVVLELENRFKFSHLSIVSHSLGGLISRDLINILAKENHTVDTFVSISSPFDGDKGAAAGVKHSPVIMPVWRDLAPNSEFLQTLFETPLPKETSYCLIFGVKGSKNSDGVVSIPSQLSMRAQNESKMMRGFNETHMSILKSKEVSTLINKFLDKSY